MSRKDICLKCGEWMTNDHCPKCGAENAIKVLQMSDLQRYSLSIDDDLDANLEKDDNGKWAEYSDVEAALKKRDAAIAEKDAEIARLRRIISELDYELSQYEKPIVKKALEARG